MRARVQDCRSSKRIGPNLFDLVCLQSHQFRFLDLLAFFHSLCLRLYLSLALASAVFFTHFSLCIVVWKMMHQKTATSFCLRKMFGATLFRHVIITNLFENDFLAFEFMTTHFSIVFGQKWKINMFFVHIFWMETEHFGWKIGLVFFRSTLCLCWERLFLSEWWGCNSVQLKFNYLLTALYFVDYWGGSLVDWWLHAFVKCPGY